MLPGSPKWSLTATNLSLKSICSKPAAFMSRCSFSSVLTSSVRRSEKYTFAGSIGNTSAIKKRSLSLAAPARFFDFTVLTRHCQPQKSTGHLTRCPARAGFQARVRAGDRTRTREYWESTGRLVGEKICPIKSQNRTERRVEKEKLKIGSPAETGGKMAQALTPLRMDLTLSYSPAT